jgi:hypothetical protein
MRCQKVSFVMGTVAKKGISWNNEIVVIKPLKAAEKMA